MTLSQIRAGLRSLPDVVAADENGAEEAPDLLSVVSQFSLILRKLGVQQTRAGTDLLGAVQAATGRIDEVHQAALDARDRAVQAERQAEKLAEVLIRHLDLLERAISVMNESGGLETWADTLRKGVDGTISEAAKWGLTSVGNPGEPFDPEVHDSVNQMARTDERVVVNAPVRRGFLLNGRVIRRAEVEIVREGN